MSKCGKSCMPECEYFTTGGCISPFNCQYKIETGYINSATSIPTYMEKQMSMTAEEIEHCLERFTMGKTTDVMNYDYAGTLAYIQRLKAENAVLRARLEKAVEFPCKIGDKVYALFFFMKGPVILDGTFVGIEEVVSDFKGCMCAIIVRQAEDGHYFNTYWDLGQFNKTWWADKEIAESKLAEVMGNNEM